jgi:hypothetical protein
METEIIHVSDNIFIEKLNPSYGDKAYILNIGSGNLSIQHVLTEKEFIRLTTIGVPSGE